MNEERKPDITLNLRSIINDLVADGSLSMDVADRLSFKTRRSDKLNSHPLEMILENMYPDLNKRIDPLKTEPTVLTNGLSRVSGDRLSWT